MIVDRLQAAVHDLRNLRRVAPIIVSRNNYTVAAVNRKHRVGEDVRHTGAGKTGSDRAEENGGGSCALGDQTANEDIIASPNAPARGEVLKSGRRESGDINNGRGPTDPSISDLSNQSGGTAGEI